ncbi:MAG TPA: TonB family protein [Vicinamibacteria bacterium]|nr:TonB family protein [Vicinamibacteria bacterium]
MNEICERVREEAALLGRAPEAEDLREHAATCAECSEFLSKLAALESGIAGLRSRDASDELVGKLLARPELRRAPNSHGRAWMMSVATAASVVLAAWLWMRPQYKAPPEPELVTMDPGGAGAGGKLKGRSLQVEEERKAEGFAGSLAAPTQLPPEFTEGDDAYADKLQRSDEPPKKDALSVETVVGGFLGDEKVLGKRVNVAPLYPEAAKNARVQGTVVLELTVDRAGEVVGVRVLRSIPLLDQAAIDAVREWKYEPSDSDAPRVFPVAVPFNLEEPDGDEDRGRVEGLSFRDAKGYWANTYVPGDPLLRRLEISLRGTSYPALHQAARPAPLPLDATSRGALSLFIHADRRGIPSKSRLLVQVGIRASDHHGRRRPPMNVGVVLDLPQSMPQEVASATTALLESLESSQELGDRFRLIVTGWGEVLAPETFRHGPLTVALQNLYAQTPSGSVSEALALALERVHAGDDPTMPLGTSVVLVVTGRRLGDELDALARMAQSSAVGGVSVSAIGVGADLDSAELERLALDGQGRRYVVDRASDGPGVIDRELSSASRTVARAVRLRIQLAEGVRLVDVLGSEPLSARESARVRAEERVIDLRLARNLGIEADRGKDEDGIQIVIPAFYAGDAHSILLDVVAEGPGPIAEVTARYKDLVQLENTVSRASLALARSDAASGPLEIGVENDYRELRVAHALQAASEAMDRGDEASAAQTLQKATAIALQRDRSMLEEYLRFLPQLPASYLRDSLLYASTLKRSHTAS